MTQDERAEKIVSSGINFLFAFTPLSWLFWCNFFLPKFRSLSPPIFSRQNLQQRMEKFPVGFYQRAAVAATVRRKVLIGNGWRWIKSRDVKGRETSWYWREMSRWLLPHPKINNLVDLPTTESIHIFIKPFSFLAQTTRQKWPSNAEDPVQKAVCKRAGVTSKSSRTAWSSEPKLTFCQICTWPGILDVLFLNSLV